jgi:hypothetical protein
MIAMRAFMYWSYQVTIKRGQNALRVVNVICGANSVYRVTMLHAMVKAVRQPCVECCKWDSPARFEVEQSHPAPVGALSASGGTS